MASSLSSVPPVWPSPRPEIIGTAAPQAASTGARISETLSPTPPVECLSSTGLSSSQASTAPESRIARVNATRSSPSIPRRKSAMASAPTWASDSPPSVITPTRKAISSALSACPSRLWRITSLGSTEILREAGHQPGEVAGGQVGVAQRLLVRERLAAHALGQVRDGGDRDRLQAGVAGQDHPRHGGHADGVGAQRAEGADLRRGLEARAGGGQVDALGQVDAERLRGVLQAPAQLGVVGAGQAGEARADLVVVRAGEGVDAEQVDVV